jgi:hypothetical protein
VGVFAELKRRNVVRVAIAYAVVAWLILQLVAVITPMVVLPEWFNGFVLVFLIVGFLIARLFDPNLIHGAGAIAMVTVRYCSEADSKKSDVPLSPAAACVR